MIKTGQNQKGYIFGLKVFKKSKFLVHWIFLLWSSVWSKMKTFTWNSSVAILSPNCITIFCQKCSRRYLKSHELMAFPWSTLMKKRHTWTQNTGFCLTQFEALFFLLQFGVGPLSARILVWKVAETLSRSFFIPPTRLLGAPLWKIP